LSADLDSPSVPDASRVLCVHAAECGGCSLLELPASEQAAAKRERVRQAFARYLPLNELRVDAVAKARRNAGYRTRAKLVVAHDGRIGLYARGTHDVLDIPRCRVVTPLIAGVVDEIRRLARSAPGIVSGIDVREVRHRSEVGVLVTLIGEARVHQALSAMALQLAGCTGVLGVAISARERDAKTLLGAKPVHVVGAEAAPDACHPDHPFHLATHGSFVQAHRDQAAAMTQRLVQSLERALDGLEQRRILELYAGSGALGLLLCKLGARPLLIERFEPALSLAREAASSQQLSALETRAGDAARVLSELVQQRARFDAVIVNPPRRGLEPAVRVALAALAPRAIAYVSCDPVTLARDMNHLLQLGHAADSLQPFDMIPLTDSVEVLVLLRPRKPPPLRVIFEDDRLIAVDKPAHLSTTPQGEHPHSLLERLRSDRDLPHLVPVHRLDHGTSGVCLFAKQGAAVAPLAAALGAGEKQYLALARGIARAKGSVSKPLLDGSVERHARTRYRRLEVLAGHSLLRVRPDQGRTHQIRRHLASIGHPVLGDTRYGDPASNRHFEMRYGLDRTFLHLTQITLTLPNGQPLVLEAPLAGDLDAVCARLRERPQSSGWQR
jgi:23S rRNA (uracil1939-C5)-methyltransferase